MALTDWQATYNGLAVGSGTVYGIVSPIEGLADHPEVVASDQPRLRSDGVTPGDDFLAGRTSTWRFEVVGSTAATLDTNMEAFKRALRPGRAESALVFQIPAVAGGGNRRILCRPRRLSAPVDLVVDLGHMVEVVVQFDCTDPRIYDDVESTVSTDLAAATTGHSWPQVWPMDWGGASTSGIVTATNAGTYSTPWVATITGPVTNPSVENVDTGQTLVFTANGGLSLGVGETLVIDSATRTALLGGTASRYDRLASPVSWWDLPPGATQLRFGGSTSGTPTMTATWRSAWI